MAYREGAGHAFKMWVSDDEGRRIRAGTGTRDEKTKDAIATMLETLRRRRRWEVLRLITTKRVKLTKVFDAYEAGTLDALVHSSETPDLSPLVDEWKAAGANAKYVAQVRRLVEKGKQFPASDFRRATISRFLAKLAVSGSTKNRYRAALSVFGTWLVEREVIESNPVRDVKGATPNPARELWLTRVDSMRLINALSGSNRALEALLYGTGLEWQAARRLRRRDVDVNALTVHAKGSKTKYRNRIVRITSAEVVGVITEHCRHLLPEAPLFTMSEYQALYQHKKASTALDLPETTLHDWRHTYAVNWLKEGGSPAVLKKQLGHAPNSTLVERVYGVWIVDASDYRPNRQLDGAI